jgi:alkylhydroperoxidase/carboxymuconolactone decarboxylase family protein YurZ
MTRQIAVQHHEEILRKLSIRDDAYVQLLLADDDDNLHQSSLDPKTHALVRIGALVAINAPPPLYLWSVDAALRHGATVDEIVGTLVAVTPAVGSSSVVAAAPKLAVALGYDVERALELVDRNDL